tara:strand:+ start:238 stop:501 length:264 start_codon:yes stop_codon:yes gene_type:complete
MKEYKFDTTNYEDIENKSVWDLYVENFRDHIWDLAPKFACDPEGGGLRVVADEEPKTEEVAKKPKQKTKKKKSKGLTQPPFKHRADL